MDNKKGKNQRPKNKKTKKEEKKRGDNMNTILEGKSTITKSGQITFPAKFIKELGLKEGDQLRFILREDGQVQVEPIKLLTANDLFGMFDQPEDEGNFVLDLDAAREERAESILGMDIKNGGNNFE